MATLNDFKRRVPSLKDGGVTLHKTHVEVEGKTSDGVLCDWNGATVKAHCLTDADYVIVEVVGAPAHHAAARLYKKRGERRQVLPTDLEILTADAIKRPTMDSVPFTRDELSKLSKEDLVELLSQKDEN